ncbi:velvet domain-containing protein [Favolaschia claudopus]|uniref:Velvet domain-containing protein n=1 Tax=Favolaschia claudopus TaxID=2862362 RepID=A0AAW0CU52_9AGAR
MYSQQQYSIHQFSLAAPHSGAPSLMIPAPSQQGGDSHQRYSSAHQPSLVGRPIHFTVGQFAGKTIRAKLEELQAAAFGRKTVACIRYAKVDRRPLDPPPGDYFLVPPGESFALLFFHPVAWLRLYEVYNAGTDAEREVEIEYDEVKPLGLMCTVDLIHVSGPDSPPISPTSAGGYATSSYSPQSPGPYSFGSSPISPNQTSVSHFSGTGSPGTEYGSTENPSKATHALAGTTFVSVDSIPWKGRTCLLFTFADLAVKTEGYFVLQYRFFDLFSKTDGHADQFIQAECRGAKFRIYSSKEVPPLGKSTELTKHLGRYGVRVNVRETERKRKKKEPTPSTGLPGPYTTRRVEDRAYSDGSDEYED